MKKTEFDKPANGPEIEINKPAAPAPRWSFWQKPGSALWVYLIFIMASLYLWQGAEEVQRTEIPYGC